MTYARRKINVSFSGESNVNVSGLRVSAKIEQAGQPGMGTCELMIYGLKLDTMSELSTYGQRVGLYRKNTVTVTAGDDQNGMSTVFQGTVVQAWPDMQSAPTVPFHVLAQAGMIDAVKVVEPSSYSGPTDVAKVMGDLAKKMGYTLENNGVNVKVDSPYLPGSPRNQVMLLAKAAGINWIIENNILAIWPQGKARKSSGLTVAPPVENPDLSLVSYPAFTEYGILVKTEFRRALQYGTMFTVRSDLKPANGSWKIIRIDYDLESETPKGAWFASLSGIREGQGPVVLP